MPEETGVDERAVDNSPWDGNAAMSRCASSSTPATCYGAICAGKRSGDPALQSSWALPHHERPGAPANAAGVRNSLARINQAQGLTNKAEAQRHLDAHLSSIQSAVGSKAEEFVAGSVEDRTVPFEMAAPGGDGLTFEGYAAVFNSPARIQTPYGEFDEVVRPGAFTRTLKEQMPKFLYEHGKHALIGNIPLGSITRAAEDSRGLHIQARLSDNWLVQPIRDAIRERAIDKMSFRFETPPSVDEWTDRRGKVPQRDLIQVHAKDVGPCVFPAYEPTTASVRSLLEQFEVHPHLAGRLSTGSADGGERVAEASSDSVAKKLEIARARDRMLRLEGVIE
jgi:uncharacterized protein